ncbi:MAG: alkaline phosphatase family protein [Oscillospiraceae bacterium]|nr:alkaline phosphatase family protein [Oscillospiraceae bacterium]
MSFINLPESIRRAAAILESVVLFLTVLFSTGALAEINDYPKALDGMGIFENTVKDSYPQTAVHNIVLGHFMTEVSGETVVLRKTPKCLIIGYDGARADALVNTINMEGAGVKALLSDGGHIYNMYTGGKRADSLLDFGALSRFQDTSTAPGWTTMLTGKWAAEADGKGHGVTGNGIPKNPETKLVFTELLDLGHVQKTSFIVSWGGHFKDENSSYKNNDIAYCEEKGYDAKWITTSNDEETFAETLAEVGKADGADVIMCILEHCDHTGHSAGFGNHAPEYVDAIKASERDAYALIEAVKARDTYDDEDWLIIITADHGGFGTGHGPQFATARQVFLAVNKEVFA